MLIPTTLLTLLAAVPEPVQIATPKKYEAGSITIDTEDGKREYHYRLLRPDVPEGVTLPLVVFMHGAGERGSDNTAQLGHFPGRWLRSPHLNRHDAFVLAVQCPKNTAWTDWGWKRSSPDQEPPLTDAMRAVMAAVDDVIATQPIDENRLYLTGLSMGGYGSWELGARQPGRWAAVVPICGGGHPEFVDGLVGTPVWAWHGTKDNVIPERRSRVLVDALRSAGGDVIYTTLPGVGHNSWNTAYGNGGAVDWMFAQRLNPKQYELNPVMHAFLNNFNEQEMPDVKDIDPLEFQRNWTPQEPAEVTIELPEVREIEIPTTAGTINARLYHPVSMDAEDRTRPLLVWYHGGGWALGNLESADSECRFMADRGDLAVLSIDYRLAPQHRFPAAADDARDAARWAIANAASLNANPHKVAVGGDSSGGNLAAVTALDLRGDAIPPALQFLVYPATDTALDAPSMEHFAQGYMLERDLMGWFLELYAPDRTQWSNWRLAPLHAPSLKGAPKAVVMLPEMDILRDEGIAYVARLHSEGVPVEYRIEPGMIHGFMDFWPSSPRANQALHNAITHVRNRLR